MSETCRTLSLNGLAVLTKTWVVIIRNVLRDVARTLQGYNEREHLFVKAAAHVFLDTPSYNAHSSGCDVLWAGLPLITIAGDKMASRVAASLVSTMGCGDTIARTEEEYAEMLTALGSKPSALAQSREYDTATTHSSPSLVPS